MCGHGHGLGVGCENMAGVCLQSVSQYKAMLGLEQWLLPEDPGTIPSTQLFIISVLGNPMPSSRVQGQHGLQSKVPVQTGLPRETVSKNKTNKQKTKNI